MSELLPGAALSSLVFLFYFGLCLLLPAAIGLLVASRLPLVGRQTDSWWLRLRARIVRRRRLQADRSTLVHDTPSTAG